MLGTASLYRALLLSFVILALTAMAAVIFLATANQAQLVHLRDERLAARAAQASAALSDLANATTPPDWPEAVSQALDRVAINDDFGLLMVMIPDRDVPSRWRLAAAFPRRPEARFPLLDTSVGRTLHGSREMLRWFDPAGIQWCSLLVPLRNRSGMVVALIEVRSPEKVPFAAELWWAVGLLTCGLLASGLGLGLVIRRIHLAVASLSRYLHSGAGEGLDGPGNGPEHLGKIGPLASSLARAAHESTTRLVRQKREVMELRAQSATLLSADRAKTTLVVGLCRSLRQSVDSLHAASLQLAQTRIDRMQRDYVETLQAGCGDMLTRIGDVLTRAGAEVVVGSGRQELCNHLASRARPSAVALGTRVAPDVDADADADAEAPEVIAGVRCLAADLPVVPVVDPLHHGFSPELRAAGAVGLVVVPVRQQAPLAAVSDAVTGIKRDSSVDSTVSVSLTAPRILVVEDNEINRLVLVRMLERIGIHPDLAENGREAVGRVQVAISSLKPYSLILMDCMMPLMDGFTATRTIREMEEGESGVWIIAVTANAMANDRARCLAAGMNDYVTKPLTSPALQEALNRWQQAAGLLSSTRRFFPQSTGAIVDTAPASVLEAPGADFPGQATNACQHHQYPPGEAPAAVPAEPFMVDFSGLKMLAKLAGQGALQEVVACFISESAKMLSEVQAAAAANDCPALRSAAHKMKGSCSTVGLLAAQTHVSNIEAAAKDGDLRTALTLLDTLPPLFAASLGHLRAFRDVV